MSADRVLVALGLSIFLNVGMIWLVAFSDTRNVAGIGRRDNGNHSHIQATSDERWKEMLGKFVRVKDNKDTVDTVDTVDTAVPNKPESESADSAITSPSSLPANSTSTVASGIRTKARKRYQKDLSEMSWERLPEAGLLAAKLLGYTQESWEEDESLDVYNGGWEDASDEIKEAAVLLGVKTYFRTYAASSAYQTDCKVDDIMMNDKEKLSNQARIRSKELYAQARFGSASSAKEEIHDSAGLNCDVHGGPTDKDVASEMIWWQDISSDAQYRSPFFNENKAQYLTFEPDTAGFNNARMGMEIAIVLAAATGRTLVLPPDSGIAALKGRFTVNSFFPLQSLLKEHSAVGLEIISMDEFLRREGEAGNLKDTTSGEVRKPPADRLDWTKQTRKEQGCLWEYLRSVGNNPRWSHENCVLAIPASPSARDFNALKELELELERKGWNEVSQEAREKMYRGNATSVDASPFDRLREMVDTRKRLCIYDRGLAGSKLVHISNRLLTHFYTFLFFQDWKADVYYKRYVRDHVRYTDDIMCAAARVVNAVRKKARKADPSNTDGVFDTMHIRRGDFEEWYDVGGLSADDYYDQSRSKLTKGSTIFIATDEKDKSFFDIFKEHYEVYFLDDFKDLLIGIDYHYFGMIDQVVAAKGRVFFGSFQSTFSGYANRIRGYYSTFNMLPGYEDGGTQSYYFAAADHQASLRTWAKAEVADVMTHYTNIAQPVWEREFPVSWRDIDKGIDLLHSS